MGINAEMKLGIDVKGLLTVKEWVGRYAEIETIQSGVSKKMSTAIRFGTSGWRAIVADEFTVANIRLAVAGIAAYVKTQPEPHRVLVGRDPRFLGESFVDEAARVLAGAGVTPI